MVQTSRVAAADPVKVSLNVVAAGAALYDQIWLGSYMSGGVGFTQYATAAYTNDVLDDFCYYGVDFAADKFGGFAKAPKTLDIAKELATEVNAYGVEQYEAFPTLLEDHFGGSQRASVLAAASGITSAIASGHSQVGLAGWYLSMLLHKESWGTPGLLRLRPAGSVRSNQRILLPVRRGQPRRAEGRKLPQLRHERRSPGRVRRHLQRSPRRPHGRLRMQPVDQGHLRQPRHGIRLGRYPRLLRQGWSPRVPRCRREIPGHARSVGLATYNSFLFF